MDWTSKTWIGQVHQHTLQCEQQPLAKCTMRHGYSFLTRDRDPTGKYRLANQQLSEYTPHTPHVDLWSILLAAKQKLGGPNMAQSYLELLFGR